MQIRVNHKLGAIFGLFVLFILISVFSTIRIVDAQKLDSRVINIAGRQGMLTQKMTKESLDIFKQSEIARYMADHGDVCTECHDSNLDQDVDMESYFESLRHSSDTFDRSLTALIEGGEVPFNDSATITLPPTNREEILVQLEEVQTDWSTFYAQVKIMLTADQASDEFLEAVSYISSNSLPILNQTNQAVLLYENASLKKTSRLKSILIITMVAGLILAVGGLILGNKIISKPINRVVKAAQGVAEGDLDQDLTVHQSDEIGILADAVRGMVDRLNNLIGQVISNTDDVASAAIEISATSKQLACGAEEQFTQTGKVASSIQRMTSSILKNSQNAQQTAQIAKQATDEAQLGASAMLEARHGMEEIVVSAGKTGAAINSLSTRTDQIGEIIQVINDIADQTNLLALNAAIEAARAGEQGRGFAVVADEVRKLAERTTKATAEISETIRAIQNDTENAVASMVQANEMVNRGREATFKTEEVLSKIVQSVSQAMEMVNQIATATEQMGVGAQEISENVKGITQITNESSTGAGQMATTAEQLSYQTEKLSALVNQFKLRKRSNQPDLDSTHTVGGTLYEHDPVKTAESIVAEETSL